MTRGNTRPAPPVAASERSAPRSRAEESRPALRSRAEEPRASARRKNPRAQESAPRPQLAEQIVAWVRGLNDQSGWPAVRGRSDSVLFAAVVALIVFGVVMVYSASSVRAVRQMGNGHYYLVRQAVYASIGLPMVWLLSRVDYHRYRPFGKPLLFVAVGLLSAVVCGLGHEAGGAVRWLSFGPVRVQPAEVTKIALIVWLADSLANKSGRMRSFSVGFLPHVLIAGVLVALCMAQPDFGSSVILMLLTFVLLFTAGAKIGYMLAGAALVLPVAFWLVKSSDYRWQRIIAFTDPLKYRMTGGYQIVESWMSFGAGGLTGVGLGDSRQKLLYLPEAHTDFIAAIVAEELGFLGFFMVVAAFALIVSRGIRASLRAVDDFGAYLGVGLTMFVGIQAVTNLSVVLGLLPTKGLTLPFLSSGGSSLLVNCAAVGILLNVSRPRRSEARKGAASADVARGSTVPARSAGGRRVRGDGHESGMRMEGGAQ